MFFHPESKFDLGHVRPKLNVEGLLTKNVHYPTQKSIQSVPWHRHASAMGFEMFDLSAMSSPEVLFAATRGCIRPRSSRSSPLNFPMQGLNVNASSPSCTSDASIRSIHSISCRMSGVSSMLRIGVAEAMGEERCCEAEYRPGTRSVIERVFDVQ